MIKVVPAIIPVNKLQLEEEINKVYKFADLVQVDISDGVFTNVKTWPYNGRDQDFYESLKKESDGWPHWQDTNIELHLMVQNPENVLNDWIQTGVAGVICHIEATDDFQKIIDTCREKGVSVGLALKPSTDINKIEEFVPNIDFIQVMGSDSLGRHGVELDEKAIELVKSLQNKYPERIIAIDIGVNEDTEGILVSAGVDKLVSGGAILNSDNPEQAFRDLESLD